MQGTYSNLGHEIEGKSRYFRKIIAWTEKKNSEEGITNSDIQKKRDIVNSKRWCSANEQLQPTFFFIAYDEDNYYFDCAHLLTSSLNTVYRHPWLAKMPYWLMTNIIIFIDTYF